MINRIKKYLLLKKLGARRPWKASNDNDFIKFGHA